MCFVVTCWERADLLALVCGVFCEFVTFPLVSWVRCGTCLYRFLIFATLLTLQRLRRNDRSMVRWICGVRDDDEVSSDSLCAMLGVQEVTAALRTRRLRWYGHVARSSSCINSITSMTIPSARRRGRPKKTWSECVKTDMKMCSLGSIDPLNREAWGLGVRHL